MQGSPWCALEFRNCAQRLDAQPLRRVRRDAIHKIAQTPHALNERRLADDPSAAEPAQPVNLGERVGDDELLAERAGRLGGLASKAASRYTSSTSTRAPAAFARRPMARMLSGSIFALDGLWRFVKTMSLVAVLIVSRRASRSG